MKVELFSKLFVADVIRNIRKCPKCHHKYSNKYERSTNDIIKGYRPILLDCGHTVCEHCIYNYRNNLYCPCCKKPVDLKNCSLKFNCLQQLNLNFFLLGESSQLNYLTKSGLNTSLLSGAKDSLTAKPCIKCEECGINAAVGICRQCDHYFCRTCFEKVHVSNVLSKHSLESLSDKLLRDANASIVPQMRCSIHEKTLNRFCVDCNIGSCNDCGMLHKGHVFTTLIQENKKYHDDISAVLEVINTSQDKLENAQKDVSATAFHLNIHARTTIENIAQYFFELHSYLQTEQQRILKQMHHNALGTEQKIVNIRTKLSESQKMLSQMEENLRNYKIHTPNNFLMKDLIARYNKKLESLPVQLDISKITFNPFFFEGRPDYQRTLSDLCNWEYLDPKLTINIDSIYESIPSSIRDAESMMDPSDSSCNMETIQNGVAISKQGFLNKSMVRISHVTSPHYFYIQKEDGMRQVQEISHSIETSNHHSELTEVVVGMIYFVYLVKDKLWYRAIAEKLLPNGIYEMLLVDIGAKITVDITSIISIDSEYLKVPFAARLCRLHNLRPPDGDVWDDDAKSLIIEVVQNKPLQLQIIDTSQSVWLVDLKITTKSWHYTLRNVFLYTGLGVPDCPDSKFHPKTVPPTVAVIPKQKFQRGETVRVKVIHVENPSNFSIIKSDLVDEKNQLAEDINHYYEEKRYSIKVIYMALLKLSCIVCINGTYYRASVEEIMGEGKVRVRLVDEGREVFVYWRDIFEIETKFQANKEFTSRCYLADIEPMQKDNYAWTASAIVEFNRYIQNPKLEASICGGTHNNYKVMLLINKGTVWQNIAALLVKNGHGVCTGIAAEQMNARKSHPCEEFDLNTLPSSSHSKSVAPAKSENSKKILKRTEVHLTNIISPNDFYIQLSSLLESIQKFHFQIQYSQKEIINESCNLEENWELGDHCFVYVTYRGAMSFINDHEPVLLRAKIVNVKFCQYEGTSYDVFLRDCGDILRSVLPCQLFPISKKWDMVSNSVYRCHLASIAPTGGTGNWSKTAIDHFKDAVQLFQSLSATLQGNHDVNLNSTPIVLWGTIQATEDPLAPSIVKYSNINNLLVKAGLARWVENMDVLQQKTVRFDELEVGGDEVTLEEWLKENIDEKLFQDIDNMHLEYPDSDANSEGSQLALIDIEDLPTTPESGAPEAWLHYKLIEKTLFTARPTAVGYDGIVYVHNAADDEFLMEIRSKLTTNYMLKELSEEVQNDFVYSPGQACVAMYHVDKYFYRGIVEKVRSKVEYSVRFIDYGNVETVSVMNMRPFAPYPNIGSFASRYRLSGICPQKGASKFSTVALDTLHKIVVEKLVMIRIEADQLKKPIKSCEIRVGSESVAQILIDQGLVGSSNAKVSHVAIKTAPKTVLNAVTANYCSLEGIEETRDSDTVKCLREHLKKKEPDDFEFQLEDEDCSESILKQMQLRLDQQDDSDVMIQSEHIVTGSSDEVLEFPDVQPPKKRMMFNRDEYKDFYREMEQQNFLAGGFRDDIFVDIGANKQFDIIDDRDPEVIELEKSFSFYNWLEDPKDESYDDNMSKKLKSTPKTSKVKKCSKHFESESEFESFQPNNSSSMYSNFSALKEFQKPTLPMGATTFLSEVVGLVTPTILHIMPQLTEFRARDLELRHKIDHCVREALPLDVYKTGTKCLARYSKDKCWYRAVIQSHNPHANEATVLYVDYLNVETLPVRELKRMSRTLSSKPLRTFRVQLHGVKLNSKVPQQLAQRKLKQLMHNKLLFTHTIGQCSSDEDNCMQVKLFTSAEMARLVYQPLIDEGIFKTTSYELKSDS